MAASPSCTFRRSEPTSELHASLELAEGMIQGAANLFQVPFATDGTHNLEGFRRRQDHLAKIHRTPREMAAKTTAAIGHQQQQETNRSKSVPMVVAHEADVMPRWRLARQTDGTAAAKIQSHRTDPDSQLIKIWRHPPAVARSRALRPNSSPEALPQAAAARPTSPDAQGCRS